MDQSKYHFIGIGGIGMSGLARLLLQRNIEVSGSDMAAGTILDNLKDEGAIVSVGHHESNISSECKVVYTTGINEENPEFQELANSVRTANALLDGEIVALQPDGVALPFGHGGSGQQ